MNRRMLILLVFFLNLMAWTVVREINHTITSFSIFLHMEVLLIIFAALYLKTLPGFVLAIGSGLLVGAARPLPIEVSVATVVGLWLAGIWMRSRIRRENPSHLAGFAAGAQAGLLLIMGIALAPGAAVPFGTYAQRMFIDTLFSAAAVGLLAAPWSRMQVRLLSGFGWNLEMETTRN